MGKFVRGYILELSSIIGIWFYEIHFVPSMSTIHVVPYKDISASNWTRLECTFSQPFDMVWRRGISKYCTGIPLKSRKNNNFPFCSLQVWFQNARAKWRRMMMKQDGKSGSDKSEGPLDLDSYSAHSPPFMLGGPPSPHSIE